MITIKQNPDKKHVDKIRKKLRDNGGYCPCSLIKDEAHKCPCDEFLNSTESEKCHCGLYVKTVTGG